MAHVADELLTFVRKTLARGISRAEVESVLLKAGWSSEQIRDALGAFAELDFPLPVPKPRPYMSAREAFLYLMLFTALYFSAYNLGSLLCLIIDHTFPDPAETQHGQWLLSSIRWSLSSVIISFPLFCYMSYLTTRSVREDPAKGISRIRKWLTYMTLFVAAFVLVGDLTTFVYNLLGGELTVRFVLKVVTVGAIAGVVFGYYLLDLRTEETRQ